ncbi:MAG: FHA domain-containing protein [Chloroflexota bacterium]
MFELTAEAIILLLRLVLIGLLYLFIVCVVLVARRELRQIAMAVSPAQHSVPAARLVVLDPGGTSLSPGQALMLRPVTRFGRSEANTIVLDGAFISAQHADIVLRDGNWWIADRGSTNGTTVNDQLTNGEVPLAPGDVVGIGDVRMRIVG